MADSNPPSTVDECATCHKTSTETGPLKRCGRCKTAAYCSVECQKADWKTHKPNCAGTAQTTGSSNAGNSGSNSRRAQGPLDVHIDKPFHKIHERKWLHDRTEQDVYKLLIDTYRLRMEDDYVFSGDADVDSIYGGARDGKAGFRRFLKKVEKKRGLLPDWWSSAKAEECVKLGSGQHPDYDLGHAVQKHDIIEQYGDSTMPMKLRMFGEQIYGSGPGGANGSAMLRMQMSLEK